MREGTFRTPVSSHACNVMANEILQMKSPWPSGLHINVGHRISLVTIINDLMYVATYAIGLAGSIKCSFKVAFSSS